MDVVVTGALCVTIEDGLLQKIILKEGTVLASIAVNLFLRRTLQSIAQITVPYQMCKSLPYRSPR